MYFEHMCFGYNWKYLDIFAYILVRYTYLVFYQISSQKVEFSKLNKEIKGLLKPKLDCKFQWKVQQLTQVFKMHLKYLHQIYPKKHKLFLCCYSTARTFCKLKISDLVPKNRGKLPWPGAQPHRISLSYFSIVEFAIKAAFF